jgi:hypothetical protein
MCSVRSTLSQLYFIPLGIAGAVDEASSLAHCVNASRDCGSPDRVESKKTYAGQTASAAYHHFTGKECFDVHLLKPARVDILPGQPNLSFFRGKNCQVFHII